MANLKLSLGMIPSTAKVEQAEIDLINEYEKLQAFAGSEELARYNELDALVNSSDFINKKKEIEGLTFKQSEEAHRESEYKKLLKSKDLIKYFKTRDSENLKKFRELDGSETIEKYDKLREKVNSAEFREARKRKEPPFSESEEYKMLQEYNTLNARQDIKAYFKFRDSKELANFKEVDGSQKLSRFEELKEYVSTEEFTKQKEYLLDKKRFEKTEMYTTLQEYEKLRKSDDIVWYMKVKDSDKFDVLKSRELTFSDEFEGENFDKGNWIPNHYWGDKLLHGLYSQEGDLHAYTDGDNIEVRSSFLRIITKPQKAEGKVWNPALGGFRNKEFDFTSGILSSGKSFRQKYGTFTAKIKLATSPGPKHSFYLLTDKITPHIDICRTTKGKVLMDFFNGNGKVAKTSLGSRYTRDFFIYTLEWTAEKLVWYINGVEVMRQTSDLPQEPMFLNLCGGLDSSISGASSMEVDWVRVYK